MNKSWLWTLATLISVALLSYGLYEFLRPPALAHGLLYGNGHIEGTDVVVSAEVTGNVVEEHMKEGFNVQQGDLLVRLDDKELRIRLDKARAQLTATRRRETALKDELAVWRHHRSTAEANLARIQQLRDNGSATPQQLNEAEDRFREARGRVGVLEAKIAEAEARLKAAEQDVALLQERLDKTVIHAPVDGTIQTRTIETGELATPGRSVAVLVDLSRLELKIYIPEDSVGKISLGDAARVKVDAYPDRYFDAIVSRLDQRAQFTPRDVHLPQERVRMVFGVTLALENPEGELKPGMPADAWIRWREGTSWPQQLVVPR